MGIIGCDWVWSSRYSGKLEWECVPSSSLLFIPPRWAPLLPWPPVRQHECKEDSLIKSDSIHNAGSDLSQRITVIRLNYIIMVSQWPGPPPLVWQHPHTHREDVCRMKLCFLSVIVSPSHIRFPIPLFTIFSNFIPHFSFPLPLPPPLHLLFLYSLFPLFPSFSFSSLSLSTPCFAIIM